MISAAWPYIVVLAALGALLLAVHHPFVALVPFAAAAGVALFFRDPERAAPDGDHLVVAPADGRVVEALEDRPGGPRLSIFLSLLDVHVNRAPVSGRVRSVTYRPGSFRPAWERAAAERNECNTLELEARDGTFGVSQIAGLVARRITCYKRPGDGVYRGERIGYIAFGSRTELTLPPRARLRVRVGQTVRGGETIVAELPEAEAPR